MDFYSSCWSLTDAMKLFKTIPVEDAPLVFKKMSIRKVFEPFDRGREKEMLSSEIS